MAVFSLFAEFTTERREVVLFKTKSGKEYTYTFHCSYENGSISSVGHFRGSSLCISHLGGHTRVGICFYDCNDPTDIMLLPIKEPESIPIYPQSRNLDLDDEPSGIKAIFNNAVRKLELD